VLVVSNAAWGYVVLSVAIVFFCGFAITQTIRIANGTNEHERRYDVLRVIYALLFGLTLLGAIIRQVVA
jgi:hypothetical protein